MHWRVFFVVAVVLAGAVVWPLALPLVAGLVLGFITEEPVRFVLGKLRRDGESWRYAVTIGVVLFILLIIIVPVTLAVMAALHQLLAILQDFGVTLQQMELGAVSDLRTRFAEWASSTLGAHGIALSIQDIVVKINSWIMMISSQMAKSIGAVLTGTPGFIFDLFIAFFAWIVFAAEGKHLRERFVPVLLPWENERSLLCSTTGAVIRSLVIANILVSFIQAFLGTMVLGFFGIPNFFLWGFLVFFASFVPVAGTGLIMVPAGVFLWLVEDRPIAGISLGVMAVALGFTDNLLRPYLMKGGMKLSLFWIFIAIVGGISQFGPAGTIIGPLAFALVSALIAVQEKLTDQVASC